jgi:hypothetical protein
MIRIELSASDASMLREIAESYLSDLRMEIAGTEAKDFREDLKTREDFLKRLIPMLAQETARPAGKG